MSFWGWRALCLACAWLAVPLASADPFETNLGPLPDDLPGQDVFRTQTPCDDVVDCLIVGTPVPEPYKGQARTQWAILKDALLCTRSDLHDPRVGVSTDGRECDSVGPRDFLDDPPPLP
ncbi:MAG TPA: hypothetical protein VHH36_06465 [Candidatus Thermoplasmatota archaeon]|nr:hypothetical protein [Candidatus Thermoplasmatota archaeon]